MRKKRVVFYKKKCYPRVYINPTDEEIQALREEGTVLINPNDSTVRNLPLHHTYPDVENNLIRPLPEAERKDTGFKNPVKLYRDKKINRRIHLTALIYSVLAVGITELVRHFYG